MLNYVSIGDLVLDIYYDNTLKMLGYYAGGSAWNDLLNVSSIQTGAKCFAVATCGNDWCGDEILQIFNDNGIDTTNIFKNKKDTKRFHVIIDGEHTKCQLACPICKETLWYTNTKLPASMPQFFSDISCGVVIVDSLKNGIIHLAQSFRDNGWFIAADIGYINHLRYMSVGNMRGLICNNFDFVQMPHSVYKFLINKFACEDESELFNIINCRYLNITDGSNGSKFIYRNSANIIEVINSDAISTKVEDPTGAGDAYFSMMLSQLDSSGFFNTDIEDVIEKAKIYAANRVGVIGANGKLKNNIGINSDCFACGFNKKGETIPKNKIQKIATNANHLLDRTLRALESNATQKLREVLESLHGQILMVGTGGSFVAAEFAAKCVNQFHMNANARACHPRDVLISDLSKIEALILFTYSGKTKDIINIYHLCKKNNIRVYVLSKIEFGDSELLYDNETLISYNTSRYNARERGFISMSGTLIPMCIFGDIYFQSMHQSFISYLQECFKNRSQEFADEDYFVNVPKQNLTVDIFSGLDTRCAAVDLESKFVESGLARVIIHEKKDFSHGRFNIVEKFKPNFIIFLDNIKGAYSYKLLKYLEKRDNLNIYRLVSNGDNIWGDLDLVIAIEFFSKYLSKALGYDMAKPEYPKDAMTLYKYKNRDVL